ncbi:MAG: ATP-binding protein [Candidatus Aminicenantes bacterium]|nr:ATP-binding protein [Candidatus Aminicenantes bacterium]
MFKRPVYSVIKQRLSEPRRFIQVLSGPRQTGKTTLALQVIADLNIPSHYASADEPLLKHRIWIEQQWEIARLKIKATKSGLFVLDEAHKIEGWSETVKRLWDEDSRNTLPLHVLLLGSSPLLVRRGLTESLAGRFEIIPITHWSFNEIKTAFGWSVDEYIFYGGYPGAAELIQDQKRWSDYIKNSLIETTISRDIFLMTRVDKPALLHRLFELGCSYSGQILSYQKMLGQLQDVGNTTTLAHYLRLLEDAGLLAGISKYASQRFRQRASSPKLQVFNTALITAQSQLSLEAAKQNHEFWGRLVESCIGASLLNSIKGENIELFYWLGRNHEVDFVLSQGKDLVALEVKTGHRKVTLPGIEMFSKEFRTKRKLLVGAQGIPIADFLLTPLSKWF